MLVLLITFLYGYLKIFRTMFCDLKTSKLQYIYLLPFDWLNYVTADLYSLK